ncbi:MAG: hypothetical protein D6822_04365 [Cyanobacteria bacterium J149]|nr:MAG: hypothetical protein D6822_04365 [Cyanobacteria bacterium J149]
MPFEISTIDTAIGNVLAGVTSIQTYTNEHAIPVNGYPAVTYQLESDSSEFYDTAHNLRRFTFRIDLLHEVEKVGEGEAARILQDVLSDIQTAFEENTSLSGAVDYCEPITTGSNEKIQGSHGIMLRIPIELVCVKLIQVV